MAAPFLCSEVSAGFSKIKGLLDEKIEKILGGYSKENCKESAKEITANYTKAVLLEFRRKLFNIAQAKASEEGYANEKGDATENVSDEQSGKDWEMAWDKEDDDCITMFKQPHQDFLLYNVTSHPYYLIWWIISDLMPNMIRMCECMASLVCETSRVKSDDYRLKGKSFSYKVCIKCELGVKESIHHIVMQCPLYDEERRNMYGELESLNDDTINQILEEPQNIFHTLMGKQPDNTPFEAMVNFWLITGKFISGMYARAISGRE